MIKQEVWRLQSVWLNGALMYPGERVFTWAKAPWGWVLLSITERTE